MQMRELKHTHVIETVHFLLILTENKKYLQNLKRIKSYAIFTKRGFHVNKRPQRRSSHSFTECLIRAIMSRSK